MTFPITPIFIRSSERLRIWIPFAYLRQHNEQRYLVLLNFSAQEQVVNLPALGDGRIALSTQIDREGTIDLSSVYLRSNEGLLIDLG